MKYNFLKGMKSLGVGLTHLLRVGGHISVRKSELPLWPGQRRAQKWGVGTPSSARLHPASRAALGGALRCRNPQRPALGGLLVCGCWGQSSGAGASSAPDLRTSPQACLVCPAGRVRTPGPRPDSSGTAPPLPARQSSSGLLRGHCCTASASPSRSSGSGPHWPQLGLLLPGLARHLSLPRDPAEPEPDPDTSPTWQPQPTPLQTKLLA